MSIMHRHIPALALVVVMAASVTGCGGSSKPLTKEEFLQKASAGCDQARKEAEKLRKQLPANPTHAQVAKLDLETILPRFNRELDRIAKLKPPAADRERVKQIIDQARADAEAFTKGLRKDPEKALARGVDPFVKSNLIAKLYGMKICAS